MIVTPLREGFSTVKSKIEAKKYKVYDTDMPGKDAAYPFVFMGDHTWTGDFGIKNRSFGSLDGSVHLWSNNADKRGTHEGVVGDIEAAIMTIEESPHYSWRCANISHDTLIDRSTAVPLLHTVISYTLTLIGY